MIKLVATWSIPGGASSEDIDRHYFDIHVPNVRALPNLRHHVVLKASGRPGSSDQRTWRGAEIWFDHRADLEAALSSPQWAIVDADGFVDRITGMQVDVFIVEQDFVPDRP